MKRILLAFTLLASIVVSAQNNKASATAEQFQGIFVFVDSKPQNEYEFLGTVGKGSSWGKAFGLQGSEYTDRRDKLVKAAKKEYPQAEGIILHLREGGKDEADVIKFK